MAAKNKFMNAMKMPAIADIFSSEAERQQMSGDLVTEVPLSELHPSRLSKMSPSLIPAESPSAWAAMCRQRQNLCWMSWGTRSCSLPATVLQFRLNQCIIQILNHPHRRPVERRLSQMMYTNVKGYQIPNLSLPKAKKTNLNRYGRMRLDYLEQNEPNLCDQMMLEGTLLPSCRKMGLDAQQMVDKTLHDLMQKAQMPDRKTNPLGWAQMCNSLKQQAEEMILPMLYEV